MRAKNHGLVSVSHLQIFLRHRDRPFHTVPVPFHGGSHTLFAVAVPAFTLEFRSRSASSC